MGNFEAFACHRVDERFLREFLRLQGASWETSCHVAATASLARSIRRSGTVGLPVATLTELIVQSGMPDALTVHDFPEASVLLSAGSDVYDNAVSAWQQAAVGRRIRLGIKFEDELREYARSSVQDPDHRRLLVKSRRELSKSINRLIASGIRPNQLDPQSEIGRLAASAWDWLESRIPVLSAQRDDLWIDRVELQTQETPRAQSLRSRIEATLDHVFGSSAMPRLIVHHGFYFYTPPQWALFQLLRHIPNVDQLFIIHDDGDNPAFDTWRRFFAGRWEMPVPKPVSLDMPDDVFQVSTGGKALHNALRGEPVAIEGLPERISVQQFRSPVGLVRNWQTEDMLFPATTTRRFAAESVEVERFMRRLGREADQGPVDLAQLPIGSFLLAIHDCIQPRAGGGTDIVLNEDVIIAITESGFLYPDDSGDAPPTTGVMRRALPFFKGCRTGAEWMVRAEHLYRLVLTEVAPLGAKSEQATDVERLEVAADNPLRLAPWADLAVAEAKDVHASIEKIVNLVSEMASRERVALKDHMQFLQKNLAKGMQDLPDDERKEIEQKVRGFSTGLDDAVDVEGLVDIVSLLLGRSATFDLFEDADRTTSRISELRGLDALGMHQLEQDLHIANLSDQNFPTVAPSVGWPFRLEDLEASGSIRIPTVEILRARAESAALGDLYLLWLATNGVGDTKRVTFSWISELNGEKQNLSPLVELLTPPRGGKKAALARAGGVDIENVPAIKADAESVLGPAFSPAMKTAEELARAVHRVDLRAAASALACSRRFALQWMLGQSHSYQGAHHHSRLYGNMIGALVRLKKLKFVDAQRTATDFWRFLTPGQRQSSLAMRRIRPYGKSAHGLWTLTLAGNKDGTEELDLAYQAAYKGIRVDAEIVAPAESGVLPFGTSSDAVCLNCPVRASCIVSR